MKRLFFVIAIALYACMANAQEVKFGVEVDLDYSPAPLDWDYLSLWKNYKL